MPIAPLTYKSPYQAALEAGTASGGTATGGSGGPAVIPDPFAVSQEITARSLGSAETKIGQVGPALEAGISFGLGGYEYIYRRLDPVGTSGMIGSPAEFQPRSLAIPGPGYPPYLNVNRYNAGSGGFMYFSDSATGDDKSAASCVTTSGSAAVTAPAGTFTSYDVNRIVTGTGIPAETYILAVNDSNSITLSKNATANGTVTLTLTWHRTANITSPWTVATIQAAIEALPLVGSGNAFVTGSATDFRIFLNGPIRQLTEDRFSPGGGTNHMTSGNLDHIIDRDVDYIGTGAPGFGIDPYGRGTCRQWALLDVADPTELNLYSAEILPGTTRLVDEKPGYAGPDAQSYLPGGATVNMGRMRAWGWGKHDEHGNDAGSGSGSNAVCGDLIFKIGEKSGMSRGDTSSRTLTCTTTSGAYTITTADATGFRCADVGSPVSGTGIPAGTYILWVDPEHKTKAWINNAATASGSASLTLPGSHLTDTVTNATTTLTSAAGKFITLDKGRLITGTNIPANTYIADVVSATQITLSQAATGSTNPGTADLAAHGWGGEVSLVATKYGNSTASGGTFLTVIGDSPSVPGQVQTNFDLFARVGAATQVKLGAVGPSSVAAALLGSASDTGIWRDSTPHTCIANPMLRDTLAASTGVSFGLNNVASELTLSFTNSSGSAKTLTFPNLTQNETIPYLGKAQTWTGIQTFQQIIETVISPTISANTNDWNPTGLATASQISVNVTGATRDLTGMAGGTEGRRIALTNVSADNGLVFKAENAGSSAANRFRCPGLVDYTLAKGASCELVYNGTAHGAGRWNVVVGTS